MKRRGSTPETPNATGVFRVSLLAFAVLAGACAAAAQFRVEVAVDLVNVSFSAMDRKGRMVAGLTAADFAVEEDGRKQQISHFAREQELPLTLALLVDISRSVERVFRDEKRTAGAFLDAILRSRDLALVMSFDRYVTLVHDYTEDADSLIDAVDELEISNVGTSLYDAVYLASREKLSREAGRKAIVVLSDGIDTTSRYDLSRALVAAHRSDTVIYSMSVAGRPRSLRTLSDDTGGALFEVGRNTDLDGIFELIAAELRSQYSLAYHSTNKVRDGKFRRIHVVPRDPSIEVRARRGYYAPLGP
jgi:VWFA-related protein